MSSVTVLFTSHNRIEKTRECVYSLDDTGLDMRYFVVDDGCTDGTAEMLQRFAAEKQRKIEIIEGNGNLYWAGGMRAGMEALLAKEDRTDYLLMVNDDVVFSDGAVRNLIDVSVSHNGSCVAGVVCGDDGRITYGGLKYDMRRARQIPVGLTEGGARCDAANMNAFMMPYDAFIKAGPFDSRYRHTMADFDYCFSLRKNGCDIYTTGTCIGTCAGNDIAQTWRDRRLTVLQRVKLKESPKGLPAGEWFYYLKKNFGLRQALWHSITPYIRMIFGK